MKEKKGKKKVMLISPMLHQGGFERICIMTARLLQKDYDVTIAVFSMEDIAFDISGLSVIDLNLKAKSGKFNKICNVLKRSYKLSRLQKKLDIDISYSFGMTANIANALTWGAKKKITSCHSFEEIKDSFYMKLISTCSDTVLCCAKKMAELVKEKYHFLNVVALWNPCDIDGIRMQSSKVQGEDLSFFETGDKVLVSMGREDDVKGFWHLLKVFRYVHEKDAHTRLAIIGNGSFTEYRELAGRLKIEDKVLFAGLKKNPFPYLKASDIYVLTSISEGLPNALVESLAVSLPIVSVNCMSGPAEILHKDWQIAEKKMQVFEADYGILTPVLTPEKNLEAVFVQENDTTQNGEVISLEASEQALASAILKLLEDTKLYQAYCEKSVQRAEDFSKENYLKGLVSCMEA